MPESDPLIVLIPVYEDWESLKILLPRLEQELGRGGLQARVVIVDDGSALPVPDDLFVASGLAIVDVAVLHLRRNLGHQRALAIGLAHVEANIPCRAVVVMDGDGEDAPDVVPKLVARMDELGGGKIVFAARTRRSESLLFRMFYRLFRCVHYVLTGLGVRVGNFSVVPSRMLRRLVVCSDMWNHYAASVHKAKIPFDAIESHRAPRIAGESRMNFVSLVTHGLCAMAVFGDRIGVRMLIATAILMGMAFVASVALLVGYTWEGGALPTWAFYGVVGLLVVALQMLLFSFFFVFLVLTGRNASDFLPLRDYVHFIDHQRIIYPKP